MVKQNGEIFKKPTRKDYDFAVTRKNRYLDNFDSGVDNYEDFNRGRVFGGYKYKLPDGAITNFEMVDTKGNNIDASTKKYGKRKQLGNSFTVNDDKVADELYRTIAGNSTVEYLDLEYEDNDGNIINEIKTDSDPKAVTTILTGGLINGDVGKIRGITHSHPAAQFTGLFDTNDASADDINGYNVVKSMYEQDGKDGYTLPVQRIYHPITVNRNPYYTQFNENGQIGVVNGVTRNLTPSEINAKEQSYQTKVIRALKMK